MSCLPKLFTFLVILGLSSNKLYAQACCSGGTPLSSSLGIQSVEQGTFRFQLAYDFNTQQDLVNLSKKLEDDRRDRRTHSLLFRTSVALSKKLSFTALFSYITQEEIINSNFSQNFKSASGIGDIATLLQYQLYTKNDENLTMALGVKFPVGATDIVSPTFGIALNPDLQPGTGSYDLIAGFNYTQKHIFKRNLNLILVSTLRYTRPADRFGGRQKYEFGNELQNLFGFQDSYALKKVLLNPSLLLKYRITGKDKSNDQEVANTSGHWLHLMPGIDFVLTPEWSFGISGELPLYRYLDGTQLTTSYRLKLTIDYLFTLKKKTP